MTIPLQITTLLFDLDGTLIHHHPSSMDVFFTVLDEHNVPLLASAHRETLQFIFRYWANSQDLKDDLEMYGDFTEDFWRHYLLRKMWAVGMTQEQTSGLVQQVQQRFDELYQPETIIPEDVQPTLKTLRRKGYKMGLVSNRSGSIDEEIQKLGFDVYFDFYFTSGDIQIWKPDPGVFEHALYLAESSPEVSAYIGDNYYTDVVGANSAGIYPILFDPRNIFPDAECQKIDTISDLISQM
jgi:HAD superfamily hydrolase (TIGR01549 family)